MSTVCEKYAQEQGFEPLSEKERKKGKKKVKIYGTKEKMPWEKVYTNIEGGMSFDHIQEKYGNIRKIVLWAIEDGIDFNKDISDTIDEHIMHTRKMQTIESINPTVALTMKEMANEYAPDLGMKVSKLSISMVDKAQSLLNEEECTSNDLKNIATAIQTMTDTVELTQRHSTVGGNVITAIQVQGFDFVLDSKPTDTDVIDVKEEEPSDN